MLHYVLNIIETGSSNINKLCKFLKKINSNAKLKYSKKVQNIFKKYGNKKIVAVRVYRKSINSSFNFLINLLSFGDYMYKLKQHDVKDCYHVWFEIELENLSKKIVFEKNNVIAARVINKSNEGHFIDVELKNDVNLKTFFNNGLEKIGKTNYYKYNLCDFNCQTWCLKVLEANNIDNAIYKSFIEQSFCENLKNKNFINKLVSFFNFEFDVEKFLYYLKRFFIILVLLLLIIFYYIFKNTYAGIIYFIKIIKPIKLSFANYHYEFN